MGIPPPQDFIPLLKAQPTSTCVKPQVLLGGIEYAHQALSNALDKSMDSVTFQAHMYTFMIKPIKRFGRVCDQLNLMMQDPGRLPFFN